MPVSFMQWPGDIFLCSCHKDGDLPFCREVGRIFELLGYYFLIPLTAEKYVIFCSSVSLPCLYTSAGMASAPGAFPVCLIALLTSSSLEGLSRSVFVSTCGRRAIASASIAAGMLRTALKCSATCSGWQVCQ